MDQQALLQGARRDRGEGRSPRRRGLIDRLARAGAVAALATAFGSALFAAGCGRRESPAPAPRPPAPYVSTATGFRFTPPPVWVADRYLVTEATGTDAAAVQPGALSIAEVQFQPADLGHHPAPLLRIYVFPDSAWKAIEDSPDRPLGGIVARARGRTYLAESPSEHPYPAASEDARAFDAMHLAVSDVKRWLSVADAASDLASEFLPGGVTFGPAPVLYIGRIRAATGPQREVKVIFRADSSALFSTAFPGRGVVNERGRWGLQGVYLRMQLLDETGQPAKDPFVWAILDSSLTPVAWDRVHYGSLGVPLSLRP
ncbi:MAG TPA: hypothetical protein VLT84_09710 [Acidobacteriota bacterium]|nr:hypothetical protein [Acidobacteriota bacterium]